MKFENKVILLTGASSGIGRSIAFKLANERCSLALIARRENLLEKLSEELKEKQARIKTYRCDVSVKEEVENVVDEISNEFGRIDIAILNAGVGAVTKMRSLSSEQARTIFNINVMGIVYFAEELLPQFLERKDGIIVGVSSLADSKGYPGSGFYCASKAAATILLESMRIELKRFNIKVITVKPGFVKTPMTEKNKFKMPFLMDADKAADIIIRGIKKEKRIIQFPLPTVIGSKLVRIIPNALFESFALKGTKT